MPIQNSINASNTHFQWTSGTQEVSDRLRQYPIGTTLNLGITYASSTLSVTGSDGTALSSTNPGYVIIASKSSPGQKKIFTVTANQGFIDDTGASEIIGNLFGLTTSVAYAADLPFFIYAVSNDAEDTVAFMASRIPHAHQSPVVGNIGAPDDAVADTQGAFFSFDNIDETLYDTNPCSAIGSFRMQMSAANDWTVQALDDFDGIGNFNDRFFDMVPSQFTATAGKYFQDNGGTGPVFSDSKVKFKITKDGTVFHYGSHSINTTPGAGAVVVYHCSPYRPATDGIPFVSNGWTESTANKAGMTIQSETADVFSVNYLNPTTTTLTNDLIGAGMFRFSRTIVALLT